MSERQSRISVAHLESVQKEAELRIEKKVLFLSFSLIKEYLSFWVWLPLFLWGGKHRWIIWVEFMNSTKFYNSSFHSSLRCFLSFKESGSDGVFRLGMFPSSDFVSEILVPFDAGPQVFRGFEVWLRPMAVRNDRRSEIVCWRANRCPPIPLVNSSNSN